jgi:spore germination cell wall hydrolase CwlJ-like protein
MTGAGEQCSQMPALAEMAALATILRDVAAGEGEEGRMALAWALLNREPSVARAAQRGGGGDLTDREYLRALGLLCRALAGETPDPTGGATRFHPHTEWPDWAQHLTPRALIGGHFFYPP